MNCAMEIDTEETSSTTSSRKQRDGLSLSELPKDDYGTVRERRDFGPLEVSLLPVLPSPFRDLSFSGLTGWRYHPTAYEEDRLQMGRQLEGNPSTRMVIPDSWNDRIIDHTRAIESTRRLFEKLNAVENSKRRRVNSAESESDLLEESAPPALPPTQSIPVPPFPPPATFAIPPPPPPPSNPSSNSIPSDEATIVTASTSSTNTEARAATPLMNPAVDLAGPDVIPKQELYFLYGKKPRTIQLKASDYLTWDNGKPVQSVKFTSAFVCPISKEVFLAKSYGDPSSFEKEGGLYWYPKKNLAEHAAAARAVDCWNLREQRHDKKRLSLEAPYSVEDAPELPIDQFPTSIREKVLEIQREKAAIVVSRNVKPAVSNRPLADTSSKTAGRGCYGRRDGSEISRFAEQYSNNPGDTIGGQIKPEADIASNTERSRWQTTDSRNTFDYRRLGSEDGRFGNSAPTPGRFRDSQGYRPGNNYYHNNHFAGRHSYHSKDESMQGRGAYGRGQVDHYDHNQSTSQSGRWRQYNQSIPHRRLEDRYGDDPNKQPPTANHSNDDEW